MRKYFIWGSTIIIGFVLLFIFAGKLGKRRETTSNCTARAVIDNQYFPIALNEIKHAKKTIDIMMFELVYYPARNGPSNRLINALIKAQKRGVKVRIIIEGGEKFLGNRFVRKVRRTIDYIKPSGINIRCDPGRQTTHSKLLIVDTSDVLLGSTNWSYYSLTKNHETNVLINSKTLAKKFTHYFSQIWSRSTNP